VGFWLTFKSENLLRLSVSRDLRVSSQVREKNFPPPDLTHDRFIDDLISYFILHAFALPSTSRWFDL
jgi:hypothetical protein